MAPATIGPTTFVSIFISLYGSGESYQRVGHGVRGSLLDILRIRALWFILPLSAVNYLPAAGLRGLWAGPYLSDMFGMDAAGIGTVTLVMGVAMVLGNLAYGPLERVLGTRKWLIFGGNSLVLAGLVGLWAMPAQGPVFAAVLLAGIGFCGASFPMVMAHGRAFFPAHLVGRGVTLLNLFSIGGTGLAQVYTGHLNATAASPEAGYVAIICGAGMAAHLAGVVAAHTTLPVIGVPLSGGALNGVDALYATVQMPKGIPVATVAIDGAMNAALLVVQMLGITDKDMAQKLADHRQAQAEKVLSA